MPRSEVAEDEQLVDAWRSLLAAHARTHGALERALKPHELGVSEYEVLERLATVSDGEQRRMQELGDAVHLSQSALSRVVARLERDGLAERGLCLQDRRGLRLHHRRRPPALRGGAPGAARGAGRRPRRPLSADRSGAAW